MIFQDLKFFATGRDDDLTASLAFIEENGGTIRTFIGHGVQPRSIHALVVGTLGANATKIACAIEKGIPVVTATWVDACAEAGGLVGFDAHRYSKRPQSAASPRDPLPRKPPLDDSFLRTRPASSASVNWLGVLPSAFGQAGRMGARQGGPAATRRDTPAGNPDVYMDPNWVGSLRRGANGVGGRSQPEPSFRAHRPPRSPELSYKTAGHRRASTIAQGDSLHVTPIIGRLGPRNHPKPVLGSHTMAFIPIEQSREVRAAPERPQLDLESAKRMHAGDLPDIEKLSIGSFAQAPGPVRHPPRDSRRTPAANPSVSRRPKPSGIDRSSLLEVVRNHPEGRLLDSQMIEQALHQVIIHDPTSKRVRFDDISGLHNCKQAILESIILPFHRPELFTGLRKPSSALLLFGPPGNGKTMLAQAIACECKSTFFSLAASSLVSKFVGDSEKAIKALFTVAHILAPSILFFDEIDALLQSRGGSTEMEGSRRLKTEFLIQVDGVKSQICDTSGAETRVMVIGATNRPFDLDDAVLRRFPKKIFVPLPSQETRLKILRDLFSVRTDGLYTPRERAGVKIRMSEAEWRTLAEKTHGYSSSDLSSLCKEIALVPIRELNIREAMQIGEKDLREIVFKDVKKCIHAIKPSTSSSLLSQLEDWNTQFGSS